MEDPPRLVDLGMERLDARFFGVVSVLTGYAAEGANREHQGRTSQVGGTAAQAAKKTPRPNIYDIDSSVALMPVSSGVTR